FAEGERARLGDDGFVEVEEGRGRVTGEGSSRVGNGGSAAAGHASIVGGGSGRRGRPANSAAPGQHDYGPASDPELRCWSRIGPAFLRERRGANKGEFCEVCRRTSDRRPRSGGGRVGPRAGRDGREGWARPGHEARARRVPP